MKYQRGTTVSFPLIATLLVLAIAQSALISYLYQHRTIQVAVPSTPPYVESLPLPTMLVVAPKPIEPYTTHAFPYDEDGAVCSEFDTICYISM